MKLHWKAFCLLQWAFGVQLATTIEKMISPCIVNAAGWGEKKNKLSIFCLFNSF